MATILNPAYGEMRGSVGGSTFSRSASGKQVVRTRVKPVNPNTAAQRTARGNFSQSSQSFVGLTTAQKAAWDSFAQSKGIKQGRWAYVKSLKNLLTSNSLMYSAGTGLNVSDQVAYDKAALLSSPSNLNPDYNVTNGTAANCPIGITIDAYSAGAGTLNFTVKLADAIKTFTDGKNTAGNYIGLVFSMVVKKGVSKYEQFFLAVAKVKFTPAAAQVAVTGAKCSKARSDWKYTPAQGQVIGIRAYLVDPNANFSRSLLSEASVTAGA